MALNKILQQVLSTNVLAPGDEAEIDRLMWSEDLSEQELGALQLLLERLQAGRVVRLGQLDGAIAAWSHCLS